MIFRLWLMDTDRTVYRHLCPDQWEHHSSLSGHEWWSKDGMVCLVEYHKCVYDAVLLGSRQSPASDLFRPDHRPGKMYRFGDAPPPDPAFNYSTCHTDPHPHFSPDDTMIGYMTTVRGMIDVAVTPAAQYK